MATIGVIEDVKVCIIKYTMKASNSSSQYYTNTDKDDRDIALRIITNALRELGDNRFTEMHKPNKKFGFSPEKKRFNTATEILEGFVHNHQIKLGKYGKGQYDISEKQMMPITNALCTVVNCIGNESVSVILWNKDENI